MDDRLYHPFNKAIFKAHPFLYDDITGRAAGKWNAKLLELVRDKKFETIYQTTLAKRFFAEKIIREFGGQGYDVSLHCLSVPSKISILGIYDRFERDHQTDNVPRWVDIPYHDMAYVEFPINAQAFETELPLTRVAAYRRDGKVVYENKRAADVWNKEPRVQAAIEKDRSKPWNQKQKNIHVAKWTDVVARYVRRFAGASEEFGQRVVESKAFLKEATLFASAVPAKKGEAVPNGVDATTTHHHIFIQRDCDGKLIAFDRSPVAAPTVPAASAKVAASVAVSSPKGPA
ncbi:MAG: zeta toxin family protein [Bdellovibrionales bacterium]